MFRISFSTTVLAQFMHSVDWVYMYVYITISYSNNDNKNNNN